MFSTHRDSKSSAYRSFWFKEFLTRGVRKVTTGITGLWRPSVHSDVAFWSFDVGSSYHCEAKFTKRWIVHPFKGTWAGFRPSWDRLVLPYWWQMLLRQHSCVVREEPQVRTNGTILVRANSGMTLRPLDYAWTPLRSYPCWTAIIVMGRLYCIAINHLKLLTIVNNDNGFMWC
jgi:hypothetical protein